MSFLIVLGEGGLRRYLIIGLFLGYRPRLTHSTKLIFLVDIADVFAEMFTAEMFTAETFAEMFAEMFAEVFAEMFAEVLSIRGNVRGNIE